MCSPHENLPGWIMAALEEGGRFGQDKGLTEDMYMYIIGSSPDAIHKACMNLPDERFVEQKKCQTLPTTAGGYDAYPLRQQRQGLHLQSLSVL